MELDNSEGSNVNDGATKNSPATEENKLEENSGVEFPGSSLEPFIGTSLTIQDYDFL